MLEVIVIYGGHCKSINYYFQKDISIINVYDK